MSDARKRKLQASLSRTNDLPESLRFVPSTTAPTNGPHVKKQKTTGTSEELPRNYDTSLLNLQCEQLLKSIRPKKIPDDNLERLVSSIQKQISSIKSAGQAKLSAIRAHSKKTGISIPFRDIPPEDLQLNFEFAGCTIQPAGSFQVLESDLRAENEAILVLELDKSVIQEKDYLNHRIHYKTSYNLYVIASSLKDKYERYYEDRFIFGTKQTVLAVQYKDRKVIIVLTIPSDSFERQKLEPNKNADRSQDGPTPKYNTYILVLQSYNKLSAILQNAAQNSPGYRDSILLASAFLSKRTLAVTKDQWGLITASLLTGGGKNGGKVLSPNASALQLFRGTVLYLSQFFEDMSNSSTFSDETSPGPGCWISGINIFSACTLQERLFMRKELSDTVALLLDDGRDPIRSFEKVFLDSQSYRGRFDLETCIPLVKSNVDYERVWRTLRKALETRATLLLVQIRREKESSWRVSTSRPEYESVNLQIMINLDKEEFQNTMILGPPANTAEAQAFRGFWGSLSELRKFKDGRILETVSLNTSNPNLDICQKILGLHFPDLPHVSDWNTSNQDYAFGAAHTQKQQTVAAEFDEFARLARDLENLPLRITSISSTHSVFSSCALHIPQQIHASISFESSARWPDNLEAIQRTKIAFLLALREPFSSVSGVESVGVCLENQESAVCSDINASILNIGKLEVRMISGIRYLLRIHLDREKTLLTTFLNSPASKSQPAFRQQYQTALNTYTEMYEVEERHAQMMRSYKSQYIALPQASILLKQWFEAHLLTSHFSDRVIDLLALSTFVNNEESIRVSPISALFCIMRYLASWDWRLDALVLTESASDYKAQKDNFEELKQLRPGHSMMIYPGYSLEAKPVEIEKTAALRMTGLAKASSASLQAGHEFENILKTPLSHFDFVLELSDTKKPTKYKNVKPQGSNMESIRCMFLQDLINIYGECLHFFSSSTASQIAILVDPALRQERKFRPNLGFSSVSNSSSAEHKVVMDVNAIIAEIERLGEGLITRLVRNKVC